MLKKSKKEITIDLCETLFVFTKIGDSDLSSYSITDFLLVFMQGIWKGGYLY